MTLQLLHSEFPYILYDENLIFFFISAVVQITEVQSPYSTVKGLRLREKAQVMGLLEYKAMPSLRDVAHDGVLCTFSNSSAPRRGQVVWPVRQAAWTVHHVQNHTLLGSLSSSQPGGPPSQASPLTFGLIAQTPWQNQQLLRLGH